MKKIQQKMKKILIKVCKDNNLIAFAINQN